MIKRVKLKAEHVIELFNNPGMEKYQAAVKMENAQVMESLPDCYTHVNAYGQVLACSGLIHFWENRAESWTFLKPNLGAYLIPIARDIKKFLSEHPCRRIEALTAADFKGGDRWMRLLGFTLEAPRLVQYREGQDHALYAIVKNKSEGG